MSTFVKPPALEHGATIGIVAPASPPDREAFENGVREIERLGFRVRFDPALFSRESFFAGSHERRVRELEAMFCDPSVAAIFCARGGYGANYLLGRLDEKVLAQDPKILLGYSDVTTLLNYVRERFGWATFHGPMVAMDFARGPAGYDRASLEQALMNTTSGWTIGCDAEILRQGRAEGILLGGCLPMLTETLGTPFEIETDNAILFLEDKSSKPYQLDRMLMHLKLTGKLARIRGVVFGEMVDCQPAANQGYRLQDVVRRVLEDVPGPILFGVRSGHTSGANLTLPFGVQARIEAKAEVRFEILEPAVSRPKSK